MTIITPITHNFNGQIISQMPQDIIFNGVMIPKGFVNATEMCKANGKRLDAYSQLKTTDPFLKELRTLLVKEITQSGCDIVITVPNGVDGYGCTYVHFYVSLNLAQWLSPKFSAWASVNLAAVINGDFQALTAEASEAQAKLQALWLEIRQAGKSTRRTLTDAIKDWYIRNPNGTTRPQHAMYAQTTNNIYKVLWGMDAITIEALLGCARHQARDFMSSACLQVLDRAECRVMEFIDDDNIKPVDAVSAANIKPSRIPLAG